MQSIKRISKIALWIYIFVVPLSLLFPTKVKLGQSSAQSQSGGSMILRGEIVYSRGGDITFFEYSGALLTALSEFTVTSDSSLSYSAQSIAAGIESGEIESTQKRWKINWDAFIMAYAASWTLVALFLGVGFILGGRRSTITTKANNAE